jgi:hypothetical protein
MSVYVTLLMSCDYTVARPAGGTVRTILVGVRGAWFGEVERQVLTTNLDSATRARQVVS